MTNENFILTNGAIPIEKIMDARYDMHSMIMAAGSKYKALSSEIIALREQIYQLLQESEQELLNKLEELETEQVGIETTFFYKAGFTDCAEIINSIVKLNI